MPTRQITSSYLQQPEAVHAGLNALVLHISLSVTWSSTDIIQVGKLPVNAIPTDAVFYGGSLLAEASATGSNATILKIGTSASPSLFFTSATYSAVRYQAASRKILGLKAQCSLSDDKMPRYVNVQIVPTGGAGGGATLGYIGELIIYYKIPGQNFP